MESELERFINGYIEALLWSSCALREGEGEPYEHADDFEPSDELTAQMREDAVEFFNAERAYIDKAVGSIDGYPYEYAGHDFALTRNGHGAGFWDRGLGEIGDYLSDEARMRGEVDLLVANDGYLYKV